MELDPSQYSEADRREVDPPIQVEMATWSKGGQLDWSVKEHRPRGSGSVVFAVRTAGSGGSGLVTFDPERAARSSLKPKCMQAFPTTPTARLAMRLS